MKKGFTLVELLAVIIILAVISTIVVPIVLNIVNDSKKSTYESSIELYGKAVKQAILNYELDKKATPTTFNQIKPYLSFEGNSVECNTKIIYDDGEIYLKDCSVDGNLVDGYTYGKATLADTILKQHGGEKKIKQIDQEWKENDWSAEKNLHLSISYTVKFGTSYELDQNTGEFKLTGTITEATVEECRNGTKQCGEYSLYGSRTIYKITSFTNSDASDTQYWAYIKGMEKTSYNGFSSVADGMYKIEDDLGMSYYYRGNTANNYVKFGTYAENVTLNLHDYDSNLEKVNIEKDAPMYWKIIRINGDGTIRLAYAGTELTESSGGFIESIGSTSFNSNSDDTKYVKYTYSDGEKEVDSMAKTFIDSWYQKHLNKNYSKYIADSIFCNNHETIDLSEFNDATGIQNPYIVKRYSSAERIQNQIPTLKCSNEESKYTINQSIGNGNLTYPVALITAEEAYLIDQNYSINPKGKYIYLYTMSPSFIDNYGYSWSNNSSNFETWIYLFDGSLTACYNSCPYSLWRTLDVSPVINLKVDVRFTGTGTKTDPYVIMTD